MTISGRMMLIVLAALLALPFTSGSDLALAKNKNSSKTRNVTRTFSNANVITFIDAAPAAPYPSTIQVSGLKQGTIVSLKVTLAGFTQTNPDDMDVLLVAPNGQNMVIMSDVGGSDDMSNVTLILDDQAGASLPDVGPLVNGTFKPTNGNIDAFPTPAPAPTSSTLAGFKGGGPNGTWRLFVVDDAGGDVGSFAGGWSLQIKAEVKVKKKK